MPWTEKANVFVSTLRFHFRHVSDAFLKSAHFGALKRLAKIMASYPTLQAYVQSPRGQSNTPPPLTVGRIRG
jgi:hypothetical protein